MTSASDTDKKVVHNINFLSMRTWVYQPTFLNAERSALLLLLQQYQSDTGFSSIS